RVLFVAEKLAALEVVRSRLEEVGLGAYCLELHSGSASPSRVHEQIRRRLAHEPARDKGRAADTSGRANRNRDRLNHHCALMASHIPELDCSLSELFWRADASKQKLLDALTQAGGTTQGLSIPP